MKLNTYDREIKRHLSADEIEERKTSLVDVTGEIEVQESAKRAAMAEHNGELKASKKRRHELHQAIVTKQETATIKVWDRFIDRLNRVEVVSEETGDVVDERAMTVQERQAKFGGPGFDAPAEDDDDAEPAGPAPQVRFEPGTKAPRAKKGDAKPASDTKTKRVRK